MLMKMDPILDFETHDQIIWYFDVIDKINMNYRIYCYRNIRACNGNALHKTDEKISFRET